MAANLEASIAQADDVCAGEWEKGLVSGDAVFEQCNGRFAFGKWLVFEFFLNGNDGIGDIRIAAADLHPAPVEAGG